MKPALALLLALACSAASASNLKGFDKVSVLNAATDAGVGVANAGLSVAQAKVDAGITLANAALGAATGAAQAASDAGVDLLNNGVAAIQAAPTIALAAVNTASTLANDKVNAGISAANQGIATAVAAKNAVDSAAVDAANAAVGLAKAKLNAGIGALNTGIATAVSAKNAVDSAAVDAANAAVGLAKAKVNAGIGTLNQGIAAAVSAKNAVDAAAVYAANAAIKGFESKVNAGVAVANAAASVADQAAALALAAAAAKVNATAVLGARLVGAGLGAAQFGQSAVLGNAYDIADAKFLAKPLAEAPADFAPGNATGNGFCFPLWTSPEVVVPTLACPEGFEMMAPGKCVKRVARTRDVCFKGPVCYGAFNETGAPQCFDDKAQQLVAGLLALKRAGVALPADLLPPALEFANASASVPLGLAKASFELHLGLVAKAIGVGKALVTGADAKELADYGSRLMSVNWPALPNFAKLCEAVAAAVKKVPATVRAEAAKVAPACLKTCCKTETAYDATLALPRFVCPKGKAVDPVGAICVSGSQLGYAKCPAGFRSCFLSAWHRPLCAVEGKLFGVDSCALFEVLAFAHKLPKQACPAA